MTFVAYCFTCRSELIIEPGQTRAKCSRCGVTVTVTETRRAKFDWEDIIRDYKATRDRPREVVHA